MDVIAIPAIDLLGGRAVRLAEGDPKRATVYSEAPWEVAQQFAEAGARRVHIVDLDGAFAGAPTQLDLVVRLAKVLHQHGVQVEVGGGLRDAAAVERLLELGVDFVVIGTLATRDPTVAEQLCRNAPGRIVVAIDARDGKVAVDGWRSDSGILARELGERAVDWGAAALLFTDVARDGLQVGAAVEATAAMQAGLPIPVIASGGVATLADLDALRAADVGGVILGRALYERAFTLEEALARC